MKIPDMSLWDELKKSVIPLASAPRMSFFRRIFRPSVPTVLDLHGMTVQQAFNAVQSFLATHSALRTHAVTIVTGKGRDGQGAIYREFPDWLARDDIKNKIEKAQNLGGSFLIELKWHKK